ncbi:hypothetical protein Q7P36_006464 [Cladosporium allicinum]
MHPETPHQPAPDAPQHPPPSNCQPDIFPNTPYRPPWPTPIRRRRIGLRNRTIALSRTTPLRRSPDLIRQTLDINPHRSRTTIASACFPFAKRHTWRRREGGRRHRLRRTTPLYEHHDFLMASAATRQLTLHFFGLATKYCPR